MRDIEIVPNLEMEMEEEQLSPPLFSRSTPLTVLCTGSVCQLQTVRPEIGSSKKSRSAIITISGLEIRFGSDQKAILRNQTPFPPR
jgi:hypothetical protein